MSNILTKDRLSPLIFLCVPYIIFPFEDIFYINGLKYFRFSRKKDLIYAVWKLIWVNIMVFKIIERLGNTIRNTKMNSNVKSKGLNRVSESRISLQGKRNALIGSLRSNSPQKNSSGHYDHQL